MLNNEDVNEQLVRCVPLFFNCDSEMQCHIRSMADSNCGEGSDVPEGKVEKVCREWLVREDGVLAYKLQKEEIQHHYGHNKQKNKLARSDLQEARTVQRSEEEEAAIIRRAYEQMLQEQEDADAMIAQQLQEKIMKEDIEKQKHMEEEDQRIAMELQRKEKLRLQKKREEKELRQVEKARAEQSTINGSSDSLCRPLKEITLENGDPSVVQECDLSDLCMDPPSNLTEEEMKNFREQQDSELARFLQEHEMKRRSQNCQDRQMAIEAQDRELARVLQEQERAKAKRARERAKQKALLQQQQESMSTIEEAQVHYSRNPDHEDGFACHKDDRLLNSEWLPEDQSDSASGYSSHQIKNVAMVIDPTYNQKKPAAEFSTYSQVSESYSPASVSPGNCDRESPPYSPVRTSDGFYVDVDDNDLESAVPPYMPIQGQRRPMSLEKGKKCKKHRDGCKTQ